MRLERITYAVPDAEIVADFYREALGMWQDETGGWGYGAQGARLAFESRDVAVQGARRDAFYWKIGIALSDLDHAVAGLRARGHAVSNPKQFRDIGYLAHLSDPAGQTIELIQVGFEGRAGDPGDGHPVGGQAVLAHLTLRVSDIGAARAWCEGQMGLRCLGVMPVAPYGFTLYFHAATQDAPKVPDGREAREWLWARPYTVLELQHLEAPGAQVTAMPARAAGPVAVTWGAPGAEMTFDALMQALGVGGCG